MDYQPYLGWGLNTFEDVMTALGKFKDGGWWVRKIDYKDAFHRELTEGPYSKKEAIKKAETWNKFFKHKELTTAKAYSFRELICNHKEDYEYLKPHLYEEYIWRPPSGAELICFKLGAEKIIMKKPIKKVDSSFEKFKIYILESGVKLEEDRGYQIFYKDKDYMANKQMKSLKNLIKDYKDYPEELWSLYEFAMGENKNVVVVPNYIKDFSKYDKPYTLDYFKRLNKYDCREKKINALLREIGEANRQFLTSKDSYNIGYNLPLLIDDEDYEAKNILISFDEKKKLTLKIEDDIVLESGCDEIAYLKFKTNKYLNLILFIAKTLKINQIKLTDNLRENCRCDKTTSLYLNIIRFLAGMNSTYEELSFVELNKEKRQELVKEFRYKTLGEFIEDEEFLASKTLSEIAKNYLDGMCQFDYVCEILNKVSGKIFEKIKDCCFEYFIDLEDIKLLTLRERLK